MNNGGPAFPKTTTILPNQHSGSEQHRLGFTVTGEGGMTMRDWFAGQMLPRVATGWPNEENRAELARRCYEMADAMLAERSKCS